MIAHVIFSVSDFEESERFYVRILGEIGLKTEFRDIGTKESVKSYRRGEHNLWIKRVHEREHLNFVRDVGLDHLAFSVESKDKVDRLYSIVIEIGTVVTLEPQSYPAYSESY